MDYVLQCERLRVLWEKWKALEIIAEQNSIGQPIIEQLVRDGLPIRPFVTSNVSKANAIEALALAFEQRNIEILNDSTLVSELAAFQQERSPTGLPRYGAPNGQHDDTVMALAMAWTAVSDQHRRVYAVSEDALIVKAFEIPENWPRAYGLDIRWETAAAIWGALDPQSDVLYLYREYLGESDPAIHASAIRSREEWVPGLIDGCANNRNHDDGRRLTQIYRQHGLDLKSIDSPVESGILSLSQRMQSGRLKVFPSLRNYLEERRLYRRDAREQIVRSRDNLQDAARCLVNGISYLKTKPVPSEFIQPRRYGTGGSMGWVR